MFAQLQAAIIWFINSVMEWAMNGLHALFDLCLSSLGDFTSLFGVDFSPVVPYLNYANAWLPLDLAMGIAFLELGVDFALFVTKLGIKFVPKIGG